jgi:hypothetical protein
MREGKILFLDSYTQRGADSDASDEIGYGITSSEAIKQDLRKRGFDITDLQAVGVNAASKLEWIHTTYEFLRQAPLESFDCIFIFHIFHQFPSEVRRILLARELQRIKLVGYTHGSHWDPSDAYRHLRLPGMKAADLGNLLSLDRLFVVSDHFRKVLLRNVGSFSRQGGEELAARTAVTGLPINVIELNRFRVENKPSRVRIVFNHSSSPSKNAVRFFRVLDKVLSTHDVDVLLTRRFTGGDVGYLELQRLRAKFGCRIQLGNTLQLPEYYTALWNSHIQISTADHESLGIATLEAMYAKNCCLLPAREAYPEIAGLDHLYVVDNELCELLVHFIDNRDARIAVAEEMHCRSLQYVPEIVGEKVAREIEAIILGDRSS